MLPLATKPHASPLASRRHHQDERHLGLERLNPDQFQKFESLIYEQSGIRIDRKKVTLLTNRVRRRVNALGLDDFDAYYKYLTSPQGVGEVSGFLDAVTTNETFFFRTPAQFDWFSQQFLSELVTKARKGERKKRLRVWSAGCANGAETYTLAICLAENAFRLRGWEIDLLGTDISRDMLAEAKRGVYPERMMSGVSESQLRRFFRRVEEEAGDSDEWEIRETIRESVVFKYHNLMRPMLGQGFDCIFVRNVMIYFDDDSKQRAVEFLLNSLQPGGYVVIGPSEGIHDLLKPLQRVSTLIYQKPPRRSTTEAEDKHWGRS